VRDMAQTAAIPLGVVLEGGYDRAVLAECVCAILTVLADAGNAHAAAAQPPAQPGSLTAQAVTQLGRYWPL